jgi:hypothetical protein
LTELEVIVPSVLYVETNGDEAVANAGSLVMVWVGVETTPNAAIPPAMFAFADALALIVFVLLALIEPTADFVVVCIDAATAGLTATVNVLQ